MGGVVNLFNPIQQLVQNLAPIAQLASCVFPPLAIATSAANLLTQVVGGAVNQAAQMLQQQCGMPNFIGDIIKNVVSDVLGKLTQPSDPHCDHACHHDFGHELRELGHDIAQSIFDAVKGQVQQQDDEATGKGGSWLVAIAKAMGGIAGKHAAKLVELSNKMDQALAAKDQAAQGGDTKAQEKAASDFSKTQSEFQAESQMFGMLQNAFSNAIKSIGEGLTTMARKG